MPRFSSLCRKVRHNALLSKGIFASTAGILLALTLTALPQSAHAFQPFWVQAHTETPLWSGPDSRAIAFTLIPQWSYLQVVAPQQGSRLHVLDPRTKGYAYVDASAIGPSASPPRTPEVLSLGRPPRVAPKLSADYQPSWVANFLETEMWAGPHDGAPSLGPVPQFRSFMVIEPQQGTRLHVWSPETESFGYLDASVLGATGTSVWMAPHPVQATGAIQLPGRAVGDKVFVRSLPVYDDETELRAASHNTALFIQQEVVDSQGIHWYTVGDGQYVLADEVRFPSPATTSFQGRWIDADLNEPAMVTAYEGSNIVYSALAIKGTTATATPKGTFTIWRRVDNETMDSQTIGIPRNSAEGYYLKDVLYTQYFNYDGASLHYNYWLGRFGYGGSHGCLGLNLDDALWLWNWANVGTPVVIR